MGPVQAWHSNFRLKRLFSIWGRAKKECSLATELIQVWLIYVLYFHIRSRYWGQKFPWDDDIWPRCAVILKLGRHCILMSIHLFIYFPRVVYFAFLSWTVTFLCIFCCIIDSIVRKSQRLYITSHSWVLSVFINVIWFPLQPWLS